MRAYEGQSQVGIFDCVTGDKLHPTAPGVFHVTSRSKDHVSHKYGVPMHCALFFTNDGKALNTYHGFMPLRVIRTFKENVTDHLGSRGCVRLAEADAKGLFEWAPVGTSVHVQGRLT